MADTPITKRVDGKYEERLDDTWLAEYYEDPTTGLWRVDVFQHDVHEFSATDQPSLEDARQAGRNFFDQV